MLFQASSFLALVAAVYAQAADPSINTPAAVVQCQPAQITFTATRTPVFISIIPGGQPSAAPLQDLGQQNASPFTWVANIAQGTSITFQIRDSSGAVAYSAPITVQNSSDSSCIGAQASTSAAPGATSASAAPSSAAPSSSEPPSSSAPPATSVVASVSSVISSAVSSVSTATSPATTARPTSSAASIVSSSTRPAASSPAASPSSTNAAMPTAKVGLAGLLGLAAAVVMA